MRGKPSASLNACAGVRITPADAGKTHIARVNGYSHKDHPRGCGENASVSFSGRMISGSPPRMRGKHATFATVLGGSWITPADAGKTPENCL